MMGLTFAVAEHVVGWYIEFVMAVLLDSDRDGGCTLVYTRALNKNETVEVLRKLDARLGHQAAVKSNIPDEEVWICISFTSLGRKCIHSSACPSNNQEILVERGLSLLLNTGGTKI